jgi:hypothetical protein
VAPFTLAASPVSTFCIASTFHAEVPNGVTENASPIGSLQAAIERKSANPIDKIAIPYKLWYNQHQHWYRFSFTENR